MDRAAAIELVHGLVAIPSLSRQEAVAATWLVSQMRPPASIARSWMKPATRLASSAIPTHRARSCCSATSTRFPATFRFASTTTSLLYGRGSVDAKGPLATSSPVRRGSVRAAAKAANLRVVVIGAVEEEAATSKGARFIAARFDGSHERVPEACVIGEPSHWHRVTLGYKGRLLLDLTADQPMAHTAGPDASVATVVVDLWNWVTAHAARVNAGKDKAFDQLSPSLRRFVTATNDRDARHRGRTVCLASAGRL